MEQAIKEVKLALIYYRDKADRLTLPEECKLAEELADNIWHLTESLKILKELSDDEE